MTKSLAVIWFEFVYVRDSNEDPEDLFILYNNIDKERKKRTLERTICAHPMLKRVQKEVCELKKKSAKKHNK